MWKLCASLSLTTALLLAGCEGDVSPGGGSSGTSTPNPFLQMSGGTEPDVGPPDTPRPGDPNVRPPPDPPPPDAGTGTEPRPGPNLDPNAFLDELGASDIEVLCQWMVDVQGGPGEHACPSGGTVIVSMENCLAGADVLPHCSVGLLSACFNSVGGDLCRVSETLECNTYAECAAGG